MLLISNRIASKVRLLVLAGVVAGAASTANASLVFNMNNGTNAARATFSTSGNQLQIILENMSTQGAVNQSQALSGLWFNAGNVTFGSGFVSLTSGSYILNAANAGGDPDGDGIDSLGGVSGEFGYETGSAVSSIFPSYNTVVSNSGLGDLVGSDDLLRDANGNSYTDLDRPLSPNGINYGIVSSAGLASNANRTMSQEPLIAGGVVITLDYTGVLDLNAIDSVMFNYGTDVLAYPNDPTPPSDPPIPAPGAALLAMIGFSLVGAARRRFR